MMNEVKNMEERVEKLAVKEKTRTKDKSLLLLELAETVKEARRAVWKIGKLAYELHALGTTDLAISDYLKKAGAPMERSTISSYRNLYQYFVLRMGVGELAEDVPVKVLQTLMSVAKKAQLGVEGLKEVFRAIKGKETNEALEFINNYFGIEKEEPEFASVDLPRPVYEMLKEATARLSALSQAVGMPEVKPHQALEFLAKLVVESDMESLKELWLREHGEGGEQ